MTIKIPTTLDIEIQTCANCGVHFGATDRFFNEKRSVGGTFFCPNGHPLTFGETELSRAKKALAAEQAKRAQAETLAQIEKRRADRNFEAGESIARRLSAQKGVTTRIKNRVANGVCPCCNRHFTNLERHMKGQHPEFKQEDAS